MSATSTGVPARLFTPTAAGVYLGGLHRSNIYKLIKDGRLTAIKIGPGNGRTMITREELDRYIDSRIDAEAVAG